LPAVIFQTKVFAYVKHGAIDKYDLELISFFKRNGFVCILSSTEQNDSILADFWIKKIRFGRDSSFLRDLARAMNSANIENIELAFFNDSMIWDPDELPQFLTWLRSFKQNAMIFPTESNNPQPHIQPYFLYARLDRLSQQRFSRSFEWVKTLHFKRSLVKYVEYPFLGEILSHKWEVQVLVKHRDLFESEKEAIAGNLINPNQHGWEKLPRLGLVGIKRSLIKFNPVGVSNAPKTYEEGMASLRKLKKSSA
jgi:hypothetical protein